MGRFHHLIKEGDGWATLEKSTLFSNAHLEVRQVRRATPSRPDGVNWSVVHRKAACVVAPRLPDGRFLLIRQERVPICQSLWEFPAGQVEAADGGEELLKATALRELQEESGHQPGPQGELRALGHFFPSSGVMDECSFLFLATEVDPTPLGQRPDTGEAITACRPFSVGELHAMIAGGEVRDANTLATWARLCAMGLIDFPKAHDRMHRTC